MTFGFSDSVIRVRGQLILAPYVMPKGVAPLADQFKAREEERDLSRSRSFAIGTVG